MASILTESVISFNDAANLLPFNSAGAPVSLSTIWRWALKGIIASDGRRVKLEAIKLGGRYLTSRQALERFASELTPSPAVPNAESIRTPTLRKRSHEDAKRKLQDLGI